MDRSLKALDLLKLQYDHHLNIFKDNKELGNPFEDKYILYLKEAITELEALKNRSCKNCIHGNKNMIKDKIVCDVCVSVNRKGMVDKTFYCNKWEVKNEF